MPGNAFNLPVDIDNAGLIRGGRADADDVRDILRLIPYVPRSRFHFIERWLRKPGLVASFDLDVTYDNADSERAIEHNADWIIGGTGAVEANVSFDAGGGIRIATDTTLNDQLIIRPNGSSLVSSALGTIQYAYTKEPYLRAVLVRDAADITYSIGLGFNDAVGVKAATGDDQALVVFTVDASGDITITLEVSVDDSNKTAQNVVTPSVAETLFAVGETIEIELKLDATRRPVVYVNGQLAITGSNALGDVTDIVPTFGIHTDAGSEAACVLRLLEVALDYEV